MAKIRELTEKWDAWIKSRPVVIQEMAKKFPPDRLYLLKSTNHRVEIYSYHEDGTFTVLVLGKWNRVMFERNVFGIKPEDLMECGLPGPKDELGVKLTDEETEEYIATARKLKKKEENEQSIKGN